MHRTGRESPAVTQTDHKDAVAIDKVVLCYRIKGRSIAPDLAFEIGFLWVVSRAVRGSAGGAAARWATVAYWLNSAPIVGVSVLCYLDPLFVLPATAALLAACGGWPFVAGGLMSFPVWLQLTRSGQTYLQLLERWAPCTPSRSSTYPC